MPNTVHWSLSLNYPTGAPALPACIPVAPSTPAAAVVPPRFADFFADWRAEKAPEWRRLHLQGVDEIAAKHLLPWFGHRPVHQISRADVLQFRAHLAGLPGHRGRTLTASRINKIFVILAQVMAEATRRYALDNPMTGVRKLKALPPEVHPFTLDEVKRLCADIDAQYKDYLLTRFFTGLRTGEINGLRWPLVDFERNVIMVRETYSGGETERNAKSEHSIRDVLMLPPVRDALLARLEASGGGTSYVFASPRGNPIDAKNFANRVFYPLLDRLRIERRRPYQTRHTTATLLLAAGENPEWIARFLGHANTEMLFTVYSRYVPNLTRRDGSAAAAVLDSFRANEGAQEDAR